MSDNQWSLAAASAVGLFTENECSMLLDVNFFNTDQDLFKSFSGAAPKIELESFLQDDISSSLYPPSPLETKPTPSNIANDILQNLSTQCKQENILPNWLEEKVELPIFDSTSQLPERVDVSPISLQVTPAAAYPLQTVTQPTDELLREFENVYDSIELTHLTPPQSPPGPATQLLLSYAQQVQSAPFAPLLSLVPPVDQWQVAAASPVAAPVESDYDSRSLDELIRHGAAQLASPSSSPSPHSSPSSSPRSSTDDDWFAPSRPKPYSRNVDDRRSRKKEQNKNAATRYRQKKKAEVEVLLNEEQELRKRHAELGEKCSDVQREIRYIKGLMRDLFKAKGLIK